MELNLELYYLDANNAKKAGEVYLWWSCDLRW